MSEEHPMNQMMPMDMRHHAGVARKRRFPLQEVAVAMLKEEGIFDGHWLVGAGFGHTVAQVGLEKKVGPGMAFMIELISLDEIDFVAFKAKGENGIVIDASKIPRKPI